MCDGQPAAIQSYISKSTASRQEAFLLLCQHLCNVIPGMSNKASGYWCKSSRGPPKLLGAGACDKRGEAGRSGSCSMWRRAGSGHYLLNGRGWRRCSQLSWKVHKGSVRGSRCRLQQDRFQLDTRGSKGWMSLWGWSNFGTGSDKKMMSLSPPILSQLDAALSNIV